MITIRTSQREIRMAQAETFSVSGDMIELWANNGETFLGSIGTGSDPVLDIDIHVQYSAPTFQDTLQHTPPRGTDVTQYQPAVGVDLSPVPRNNMEETR